MTHTRIITHMPADLLDGVDDFRRDQHPLPSRAGAIRRLVAAGLEFLEFNPALPVVKPLRMTEATAARIAKVIEDSGVNEAAALNHLLIVALDGLDKGVFTLAKKKPD